MIKAVRYAILLVMVHALVGAFHGTAHQRLDVPLSLTQNLFVITVITIAPLAAALLLWKNYRRAGAVVLLCSMAGSLLFGIYNHFVEISPDHVSEVARTASGMWVTVFQVTAALLAIIEAVGCVMGARLLLRAERD